MLLDRRTFLATASIAAAWPTLADEAPSPLADYERTGDVPNVVFPSGLLYDEASDEIRLYYGAADSSICLATARLRDLLDAVLAAPCEK